MINKFTIFCFLIFITISNFKVNGQFRKTIYKWSNPNNLVNLNSSSDDFAPVWNYFENKLYFNSTSTGYSKFYYSVLVDSFNFKNPELLPGGLNQSRNNQSYITFAGEDRAYLNTFRMDDRRPYQNVFETILTRSGWSAPMILDSFKYSGNLLHPTVSPDGRMMVFSTDINSINGNLDLWSANLKENGSWGGFEKLTELNTPGNEITPFFSSNDTLYFASDGQSGPGGYDLFYSIKNERGNWQKPNPITELNTAADESDFTILPNKTAVFASNRAGGKGGLDLYFTKLNKIELSPQETANLEISVATQSINIKVIKDETYQLCPLINTVFTDANEIEIQSLLSSGNRFDIKQVNIDSLYLKSLLLIPERMKLYPGSNLILEVHNYMNDEEVFNKGMRIADLISKYIFKNGIDTTRISIKEKPDRITSGELLARPLVVLRSDEAHIFDALSIGKSNIIIDPPFIDVYITVRPIESLKSWNSMIYFNQYGYDSLKSSKSAQEQFSINLQDWSNKLSESDSVVLIVDAVNKADIHTQKEQLFVLTQSKTKIRDIVKIGDISYEQVLFFIPDNEVEEKNNYYNDLIKKTLESSDYARSIKVQFFTGESQNRAISLLNIFKRRINNSIFKMELEQKEYSAILPFSRKLSHYAVRVLIEK